MKIVFNYLSNALKYTPRNGEIRLGLSIVYGPDDDKRVRLWVKDSGPGISKMDQRKLFKAFSQVDGSTKREYEGTGLGLALVKDLAEEMNGAVGVDSEPGKGSTFWFELPGVRLKESCQLFIVEAEDNLKAALDQLLLSCLEEVQTKKPSRVWSCL